MRAADFRIVRGFKERQRSWSADVSGVVPVEVPARFYICFGNNVYRFRSGGKRFVFRGYFQADESCALAETEGAGFGSEQQPGGSEKQAGGQKHKVFFQHRVSFVKSAGADCKTAFGGYHSG